MQKVIFRAQGNGSLSRPFILEVDHEFDKNSPFMVEIEANYEGFERVTNYFAFSNNSEVMLLSYLKLVDNHYIEHETEHALARTFIATDKNHIVDGPFVVSIYGGITYLSKMQLHDGVKIVNSEFIKIPKVSSLQEWVDKINKGIGIYIIDDLTEGIVYYTRGETRDFLSGPVIVEVIAIDEHSEPGKSYQYIRVRDTYGNEAIGYFDVEGLSDFVETASDPLVAAADYILPIVKREIIEGGAVAPYAEESGKTTYDDLDRKISDTYHAKKEDLIIEAASPDTPSPRIRMRAHGETEVEEYNIQALTDGSLRVEKTDLNQAPFVIKSDGTVEIEKLESPSFDTKVDKPAGSPNNYFSESNEYLPLQRFARVRYQSTSGWAKVAEVTLPASADERKSAIFFINCENNTSTTSESWFGILEWNIHETPASNSIKWLVTYGFGENNFNIRYHSGTNTLSFFVLPTVGNMNLWLASESTNGHVTSDIVLFDATDSTQRTGVSVAAKADYLSHAGHVRDTRKVADIALSRDISVEALINALKASGPNDTDKLTTVGIVADMFAELVNGAPAALDTLQELAKALGDDPNFATTITNLIGTKADKTYVDGIITTPLIEVTWQELKDLRDSSALVPGQQYRITDYVTTTTQASTRSAGHQFDIIVTADDVDKLNENARAVQHDGDTYFANSKLEAWQLKYCLDNDTSRFAWAQKEYLKAYGGDTYVYVDKRTVSLTSTGDTEVYFWARSNSLHMAVGTLIKPIEVGVTEIHSLYSDDEGVTWYEDDATTTADFYQGGGKGVIYRMIDEFNNDCPYDFKNIQFKRKITDGEFDPDSGIDTWVYTFTGFSYENNTLVDGTTLKASEYFSDEGSNLYKNNSIGIYEVRRFTEDGFDNILETLSDNVFIGRYDEVPYVEDGPAKIVLFSFNNNLGRDCYGNTFGNNVYNNTFGSYVSSNSFGNNVSSNSFGNNVYNNSFGNGVYANTFGSYVNSNTFGNDVSSNSFGNNVSSNSFGNGVYANTFGSYVNSNTFGNDVRYNSFGNDVYNNSFGNFFWYNTVKNYVRYVRTPNTEYSNRFQYVTLENGLSGASSANKLNLEGIQMIVGHDTPIKVARGTGTQIVAVWHVGIGLDAVIKDTPTQAGWDY